MDEEEGGGRKKRKVERTRDAPTCTNTHNKKEINFIPDWRTVGYETFDHFEKEQGNITSNLSNKFSNIS